LAVCRDSLAEGPILTASRLLPALCLVPLLVQPSAAAGVAANASYVVNLGGSIIANATFDLTETDTSYDLKLNANVSGFAQLVASGTAKASSTGTVSAGGLESQSFDLTTHSGGEDFSDTVQYSGGNVSAFIIDPPIVNNINRVPVERSQLSGVNDMLATFVLRGSKLDKSLCDQRMHIFTGIERFDLTFSYAKDDVATSKRTGYQGPVVLCHVNYKPISGHYTTSELTNSLTQNDRILILYAPLHDTGLFIPYRVLLTTSMGDLSMVLTTLN
jgi:hypothetical protein